MTIHGNCIMTMARTLRVTIVWAFTSCGVETAKDDDSDHTQRNHQQAAGDPYDDVAGHVHHVTFHAVWNTGLCSCCIETARRRYVWWLIQLRLWVCIRQWSRPSLIILFLSVIIRDCAMHPNTTVTLVNGRCYKISYCISVIIAI